MGESGPNLCSHFTPLADEGLWDMFVKDIPRSATSYTVSLDRLRPGVTYEFRVVAVNQVGYGEPSSPSTAVSGRDPPRKAASEGREYVTPSREGGDLAVLPADSPAAMGFAQQTRCWEAGVGNRAPPARPVCPLGTKEGLLWIT